MLLASKHCAKQAKKYDIEDAVVGVGGGSVIDKAKIIAKAKGWPCIAVPTTAAGASETSHAVVWGDKKYNVDTDVPVTMIPEFRIRLPAPILEATLYDCYCHILESRWSENATAESLREATLAENMLDSYLTTGNMLRLIHAGIYAGRAIEITGTNIVHQLSYKLTLKGMPHGLALKEILRRGLEACQS